MLTRVSQASYEPYYGPCGTPQRSCYLGTAQSSGRGGAGDGRPGSGPVAGAAVLALAQPAGSGAFFYLAGDPRKHLGAYSPDAAAAVARTDAAVTLPGSSTSSDDASASAPASPPVAALAVAAASGDVSASDLEACSPLRNAAAVAGRVCVAVRGGCPFAVKTLNCQAAGAAMALLLNNNYAERGAPNTWGLGDGIAPAAVTIPTVALSARDGARLLTWLLDPKAPGGAPLEQLYSRPVAVNASAYACAPQQACPACAPGLAAPAGGGSCGALACPGLDERYNANCSGRGVCSLDAAAGSASCACDAGWAGPACDASTLPPVFAAGAAGSDGAALTARAGTVLRFAAHADDPAGGAVTYALGPGAPEAARLDSRTGILTLPTAALGLQPGDADRELGLTVVATAPNGLSASRELRVLVAAPPGDGATSSAPAPPAPASSSSDDTSAPLPDSSSDGAGAALASDSTDAPAAQPRKSGKHGKKKMDGGAIAGTVIGVLVAVALAALAAMTWRRRTVRVSAERHVSLVEF